MSLMMGRFSAHPSRTEAAAFYRSLRRQASQSQQTFCRNTLHPLFSMHKTVWTVEGGYKTDARRLQPVTPALQKASG